MAGEEFYNTPDEASRIKIQLVCEYFEAWSDVIMGFQDQGGASGGRISYIDLFAGKGVYDDGTPSTPIRILQMALNDEELRERLYVYLNEAKSEYAEELRQNIRELDGIDELEHQPTVVNEEVTAETAGQVEEVDIDPSLVFLDPWGYAGLTAELFEAFLGNWGTDVIFFFNYNRINAGLGNRKVAEHMDRLFGGKHRTDELRQQLDGASPENRQQLIIDEMQDALKAAGGDWLLNFEFRAPTADRPSHYVFFATEHPKGFDIMKRVMNKRSSGRADEAPLFDEQRELQTNLVWEKDPIEKLRESIRVHFAGERLTRDQLYRRHQRATGDDNMFLKKHYNEVLRTLENEGVIQIHSTKDSRRKGTFPDHVEIKFPPRQGGTNE